MIKNRKQMYIIIGIFTLILFLGGTTYAWFTYRGETSDQELIAGNIYLHLNEGQDEITMTNIFPETKEEARARSDNYMTFEITGVNTSNKTIYYEILLSHGDDKASPKSRYRDSELVFDLAEIDSNGNVISYVVDGQSYDTLNNTKIWVDTIDASTTSDVSKKYKLRMWLSDDVIISDSESNAAYTTTEFSNKYATVKIAVNGDFIEKEMPKTLYQIISEQAVMDNINSEYVQNTTPGIDFGAISSDTNGKGVYTRAGTENNPYPIYYYRGAVEDNNVKFANKCWKTVRTTDTGGIKLIYNGEPSNTYEIGTLHEDNYSINTSITDSRWTFDSSDDTWNIELTNTTVPVIEFTVPSGNDYSIIMTGTSGSSCGGTFTFYKNDTDVNHRTNGGGGAMDLSYSFGTLNSTDRIKMTYSGSASESCPITFKLKMEGPVLVSTSGCDNKEIDARLTIENESNFKFSSIIGSIPAYVGYMYNDEVEYGESNWEANARFGSSYTWDGTKYVLVDDSVTQPDTTHHYSCNLTTSGGTCADLRYVFYNSGGIFYIVLKNGDDIDKTVEKMAINKVDSNAKLIIDEWYEDNMMSYTSKLEDAIWCNDRSIDENQRWKSDGTFTSAKIYFGAYQRSNYADSSSLVKNQPSLVCINKNDRFTVSKDKGNGALKYPIALLTADESVLAGGVANANSSFYLNDKYSYRSWLLSPLYFKGASAYEFTLEHGYIDGAGVTSTIVGIRPSISLKHGSYIASGTGTVADPYVIE